MHQPWCAECTVAVSTGSPAIGLQWTLISSCFDALLVLLQQLHQRSHLGRNNLMKAQETWRNLDQMIWTSSYSKWSFFLIELEGNRWFFWSFERREWEYFHVDLFFLAHCEIKWCRPWQINAFLQVMSLRHPKCCYKVVCWVTAKPPHQKLWFVVESWEKVRGLDTKYASYFQHSYAMLMHG